MQFASYVKIRNEKFGAVVFDTLSEKVHITNKSGKEILSLMVEGLSPSAIAEHLGQRYEESSTEIENDVTAFIASLGAAGLLAASVEEKP